MTYYSELCNAIAFHNIFHTLQAKHTYEGPTPFPDNLVHLGTLSDPNYRLIILLAIGNSKRLQKSSNTN